MSTGEIALGEMLKVQALGAEFNPLRSYLKSVYNGMSL